jgi:hypothetical protein
MSLDHLIGRAFEPRLTVDGMRDMIGDLRRAGRVPRAILVSEYDRRELNQDVMSASVVPVAKEDQKPEHDRIAFAVIEGVMIMSSPEVPRGKARLVHTPQEKPSPGRLGGEGKIIVGA